LRVQLYGSYQRFRHFDNLSGGHLILEINSKRRILRFHFEMIQMSVLSIFS